MTKVTKNPGRVLAGKKLQEWNKSHKEDLKKKIEELETRLESTLKQPMISSSKEPEISTLKEAGISTYKLTSMILLITSITALGYILYSKKTAHQQKLHQQKIIRKRKSR